ncbi:MAG: proline hydroxylase [Proteobacteria bacterium]|nr:MAG: proline hydroxylase [Pseudomonadota bacterium]
MGHRAKARSSRPRGTLVIDRPRLEADLDARGSARIEKLVDPATCVRLQARFEDDAAFRKHVVMARHGYGRGEYKYFAYPLPAEIAELRTRLYRELVPIANRWNEAMRLEPRFPTEHAELLARCHAAGQERPTPLMLRYGAGDYNCLHQDLYGEHVFPLQVVILLSEPGRDFEGGELVMTEQRPRMQSRVHVLQLKQGDALVFAVHQRPVHDDRAHAVAEGRRERHRVGAVRPHRGARRGDAGQRRRPLPRLLERHVVLLPGPSRRRQPEVPRPRRSNPLGA